MSSNNIFHFTCILILSCQAKQPEQQEFVHEVQNNVIVQLKPEQIAAIDLQTTTLVKRNLQTSLRVNGKLTLPPQNQANVSLPIGGIVKSILITEGAYVNKGDVLATIENTEFIQVQQNYLQSKFQLEYLKAEFDRQRELQKDNINAAKILQKAESDYRSELTNYNALIQKLKLYNVVADKLSPEKISNTFAIIAPISGNIHTIGINIGTFAEPNKQIMDIVNNQFIHIDLTIFEKDISKVHEGQKLIFTDANDPMHLHNATIFSINKAFEEGKQAVIAHAKIENVSETLLSGMFIEARIDIDNNTGLSLPSDGIVSNGNEHYVFVEQESNTFRQIPVRIGTTDQNYTEIVPIEEIHPEQKVVVKGAYYLLSELTKGKGGHHD